MRIGVCVASDRLVGVFVRTDGSYGMHSVASGNPEPVEALLSGLRRYASDSSRMQAEEISSICFDVSSVLRLKETTPVTVIRIAPRPPVDAQHDVGNGRPNSRQAIVVHIAGGHTTLGEEIVPLDEVSLRNFAAGAEQAGRYVVTSVGALVNAAHELKAGQILLQNADPAGVAYSHTFASSSFEVRERTAALNSALVPFAESLATALALVAGEQVPEARLYVTGNDGGRMPLSRLSTLPVHSMFAGQASELIGAAALSNLEDGAMVVADGPNSFYAEILAGVPVVVPQRQRRGEETVATQSAKVLPVTALLIGGLSELPTVVSAEGAPRTVPYIGLPANRRADVDLRALGAACAPLTDWVNRVVSVNSALEMEQALAAAEARATARLVSFGAAPSAVRIVESRVAATTYENPRVVSVRVRAVAGDAVGSMLRVGEYDEAQ